MCFSLSQFIAILSCAHFGKYLELFGNVEHWWHQQPKGLCNI